MSGYKVAKNMKALPQRPAPPEPTPTDAREVAAVARARKFTTEFAAFRKQLEAEGWFEPDYYHTFYRILEVVLMHLVGLYLMIQFSSSWELGPTLPWTVGLIMLGIVQGRCGWLMHEGGHFSMTGNPRIDTRLQELLYGLGCGMSGAWWRIQHNKHHTAPQKLNHDVDLDTLPFVAFHSKIAVKAKNNPIAKIFVPMQAYLFSPVICTLITLQWQFFLHPRHIWRTKRFAEAFWFAVRYFLIYQIFRYAGVTSFYHAAVVYVLYNLVGGTYIFTNFALSHTHLPVTENDESVHWLDYAAKYTVNITPHFFTNWWMGYLNFQIEHHLFPTMPQFKFVQLAPRTKRLFETCGLKYDVRGYFDALQTTFGNLRTVSDAI